MASAFILFIKYKVTFQEKVPGEVTYFSDINDVVVSKFFVCIQRKGCCNYITSSQRVEVAAYT